MVTSSEDGTVKIWETRTGSIQRSYNHGCPANDVVIHPNQGEIISCDRSGSVRVWDLAENNCSHELIPEEDVSVSSVTVASDGSLLCAANNAVSEVKHDLSFVSNRFLGQCICVESHPELRPHAVSASYALQRPQRIHHPYPSIPRRQEAGHL
jgi:WD40 repeat protein